MNKAFLLILLLVSLKGFSQNSSERKVTVTKFSSKVPYGKKWILESGKVTRIQVSDGIFNSGSACNASFLSSPRMVFNIVKGNVFKGEGYGIIFKDCAKVPYTNDYTFDITPISFIDQYSSSQLQNKSPESVGVKKIEFLQGDNVFMASCLESIELVEVNMVSQDYITYNKEQTELHKQRAIDSLKEANAQKTNLDNSNLPIEVIDTNKIYTKVDQYPEFPGGDKSLYDFIQKNNKYPAQALKKQIEGTVVLKFVVNTNGKISDIEVIKGVDGGCTEEAVSLLKSMPDWRPGNKNGVAVRVSLSIPISYRLEPTSW